VAPKPDRHRVVVLGAGAAGLGVAAELGRRGVEALVVERGEGVGTSWRSRYEDLRLNTDRSVSGLPGGRIPRRMGRWPGRDDFIAFLDSYAEEHDVAVRLGTEVHRVDRDPEGWRLQSSDGPLSARFVVVCTGHDRRPRLPAWPGMEAFPGRLLHAAEFRDAAEFAGEDVLVVGLGTSGTEIATRLTAHARRVRLAFRSAPNLMPETFLGVPITLWARLFESAPTRLTDSLGEMVGRVAIGDLSAHGLPPAPYGLATELKEKKMGPVVDRGFSAALTSGSIELVAAVEGFEEEAVRLHDDTRLRPDAVIAATGYRPGLEPLVGHLGVLRPSGQPAILDRAGRGAPGLFFNGYWLPLAGELPAMRRTSRRIARAIAADARKPSRPRSRRPRPAPSA
jgi:cation diffusion facilitator CzcD-associated flavoprotein CzcO